MARSLESLCKSKRFEGGNKSLIKCLYFFIISRVSKLMDSTSFTTTFKYEFKLLSQFKLQHLQKLYYKIKIKFSFSSTCFIYLFIFISKDNIPREGNLPLPILKNLYKLLFILEPIPNVFIPNFKGTDKQKKSVQRKKFYKRFTNVLFNLKH